VVDFLEFFENLVKMVTVYRYDDREAGCVL